MWSVNTSTGSVSGLKENMTQIGDLSCNCSYAVEPDFGDIDFYSNIFHLIQYIEDNS